MQSISKQLFFLREGSSAAAACRKRLNALDCHPPDPAENKQIVSEPTCALHEHILPLRAQGRFMECWDVLERAAATPSLQSVKDGRFVFGLWNNKCTSHFFFSPPSSYDGTQCSITSFWLLIFKKNFFKCFLQDHNLWFHLFQVIKLLSMTAINTLILNVHSVRLIFFLDGMNESQYFKFLFPLGTPLNYFTILAGLGLKWKVTQHILL